MDHFQIETAQNVNISQNAAGIGDRILAFIIDAFIMFIYILIISFTAGVSNLNDDFVWLFVLAIGLPLMLYHLLWEMFWDGRSPGKAVLKLRVVKLDGSKPAFSNYLLRWLLRIVDISLTSGALATVTILLNGKGQRLGDVAATTTVITEKKTVQFSQTILMDLPEDYTPTYPQVTVFTDAEMQTIKTVFNRAKYQGSQQLILKLSEKLSSVMETSYEGTPIAFVDTVIKDYNYYTQNM